VNPGLAIGLLFSARGLGTGVGPIVARAVMRDRSRWPAVLGACVVATGMIYLAIAAVGFTYGIAVLVAFAHAASGANWVLSTVLLQERTEDRWRGRVFATEWLLLMGTQAVSILAASLLLDTVAIGLSSAIVLFAVVEIVVGAVWWAIVVPRERKWTTGTVSG